VVKGRRFAARKVICSLLLCAGCSPVAFVVRERSAERAVAAADAEGARASATYELMLARLYLDKAREESAEAHYAWALDLLAKSEQSANRARTLSVASARARVPGATVPAAEAAP
jgi:hypothetical protein